MGQYTLNSDKPLGRAKILFIFFKSSDLFFFQCNGLDFSVVRVIAIFVQIKEEPILQLGNSDAKVSCFTPLFFFSYYINTFKRFLHSQRVSL